MQIFTNIFYYYWDSKQLFPLQEFLVLWFIYNFSKLLLVSIVNELVWPTQFFNRRHNNGYQYLKYRVYSEVILKLIRVKSTHIFFLKNLYNINIEHLIS